MASLREVAEGFVATVKHAADYRGAGRDGMHAQYHGDFSSVPPSSARELEWWARRFEQALEDELATQTK